MENHLTQCVGFDGHRLIAVGVLSEVAIEVKRCLTQDETAQILVFDDITSEPIELDLRGTEAEVARRYAATPGAETKAAGDVERRGPGRPKLGVVAREVTLLPRHWEWLASQPGGASVALRKLVEQARTTYHARDRHRRAQESVYRFLSAVAGNLPAFEEATRALFGGKQDRFQDLTGSWPADVRSHARKLAARAFGN